MSIDIPEQVLTEVHSFKGNYAAMTFRIEDKTTLMIDKKYSPDTVLSDITGDLTESECRYVLLQRLDRVLLFYWIPDGSSIKDKQTYQLNAKTVMQSFHAYTSLDAVHELHELSESSIDNLRG